MTLQLVLTADSVRGSTELDAWWRTEKAFAIGFPGPGHFFWVRGLDNNICRLFQKHRLSAQAPEHGSGEDIYLAGWLGTRMTRPHVICSITIYDPVILNHKKRSSTAKTRIYPSMLIVYTATAVFQKHADHLPFSSHSRDQGRRTHSCCQQRLL